jgi:hypothetical protein
MKIAVASEVSALEQNRQRYSPRSGGAMMQRLLEDDTPDGFNFRIVRSQFQAGEKAFRSPRHRHAFQQIRFTEKGLVNHAPDLNAAEGDITYFPRAAYYGPQEKDNGIGIALQFGYHGEHQMGEAWEVYRDQAVELLKASGSFEGGVYTAIDPATGDKTRLDAVQAIYEKQYELRTGKKFEIPPEGYQSPILMHPSAFSYYEIGPGVEVKTLGRFYDQPGPNGDVRIGMVRLAKGGVYRFDADRAQLAWTLSAGLAVDGTTYPERTFVYSPKGETLPITSGEFIEVYTIDFPRLD